MPTKIYAKRGIKSGADFWDFIEFIIRQENRRFDIGNVCHLRARIGLCGGGFVSDI